MSIHTVATDSYSTIFTEISSIGDYIKSVDDNTLIEDSLNIVGLDIPDNIGSIFNDFFRLGSITSVQRKQLEGYFTLLNSTIFWDLNGKVFYFG